MSTIGKKPITVDCGALDKYGIHQCQRSVGHERISADRNAKTHRAYLLGKCYEWTGGGDAKTHEERADDRRRAADRRRP